MKSNINFGVKTPSAYIAVNRQRVKQYGDTVYLKNGDEFQLELFNPTQTKVVARITLNSKSIGDGIIIRPGERVFLDRYVSEAKKFLFETYSVEGNDEEVKKAIEKNGDVVVKFYPEEEKPVYRTYPYTLTTSNQVYYNSTPITYNTCGGNDINNWSSSTTTIGTTDTLGFCSLDLSGFKDIDLGTKRRSAGTSNTLGKKSIETGRVEKGGISNQRIGTDYTSTFSSVCIATSEWKLLPQSRKPVTVDDLVQYCTVCGRKKREGENYCPKDGNKF